ncbi:aldehyde dehydrogenase [Aureisphaera sp. CAU 1614]|uniref:Aldehyde dehydrogenase n=1 Tax=Halomarinibacterium sedimenti TaxID=2857106 RepID=A0A9X1K055_9FLAO|nr:aldehyde dehydrogenase [Halomarinibacterium sedimenti]MBW2938071.1 aldehyde dehydrogenase [Halomarinibacterium sedimenti]
MHEIVSKQRTFFNSQKTKELSFRLQQLKTLEKVLKQNEKLLLEAIYKDFKKSSFETYATELALVYQEIAHAKKYLSAWARPKRVATNWVNFPAKSYIIPEPLGVCLVIGAWNYPYNLSFSPVVAAIAAGNTIILKPSEIPSETSKVMYQLISEHFDEAFFTVVEGGVAETTELLKQKFDKIFFTGSTPVGKIIYKAGAEQLTPVTLELGGKSPAFVTASANITMTAKRLVWGKFLNAGQTCIATDYVMVDKAVEAKFLEACKREIEKANYAFENNNYVQIINDKNFERLASLIDTDKVYYGGNTDASQRYIEPTILQNVDFEDAVMQDEIFGPILPVIRYSNLSEAIQKVQQLPKPLSCYVFTTKASERKQILNTLSFGGGAVNDTVMQITNSSLPFGGVGLSGMGSYHGEAGFKTFSHYKSILHKANWLELPLKYSPLSNKKLWWIKQFFKF